MHFCEILLKYFHKFAIRTQEKYVSENLQNYDGSGHFNSVLLPMTFWPGHMAGTAGATS